MVIEILALHLEDMLNAMDIVFINIVLAEKKMNFILLMQPYLEVALHDGLLIILTADITSQVEVHQ
jgi:hypothetical protein